MSFSEEAKNHLCEYKHEYLPQVTKSRAYKWNNSIKYYKHILPEDQKELNFMISKEPYIINKNRFTLLKKYEGEDISFNLHTNWHHLNSSQILGLNYFNKFIGNTVLMNELLSFLEIKEGNAKECRFEKSISDRSDIDFYMKLDTGVKLLFEIKYTEERFGSAGSASTDYLNQKNRFYSRVEIADDEYLKHYKFVRLITNVDEVDSSLQQGDAFGKCRSQYL